MITKKCGITGQDFVINDDDIKFYERWGVPLPTLSPLLRIARIMAFRNERKIYSRKCDFSGKNIISSFPPDSPHKVYEASYWYSEKFNPLDYGRDFDFSRDFFSQFHELMLDMPLPSLRVESSENCEYNSDVSRSRNCYLCSRTHESEDILYSYRANKSSECVDCRQVRNNCELLYECVECDNCYNGQFLEFCTKCVDSSYLSHCVNCNDCFMSTNLERGSFYFLNEKLSKNEYEKKIAEFDFGSRKTREKLLQQFTELKKKTVKYEKSIFNSDNCTGDNIANSKDCHQCYDISGIVDGRYLFNVMDSKDVMDCYSGKKQELNYQCTSCTRSYNTKFSMRVTDSYDCEYGLYCRNSRDLFGCIGVKQGKYCILNKQYSEEEYKELREKIIAHMKKNGEYGEFFPPAISPFSYNETVAYEYFPVDENFAKKFNWRWQPIDKKEYQPSNFEIPDNISDVDDSIFNEILACAKTGKNYKIVPKELAFYRKMNIPVPIFCPDERHIRRFKLQKVPSFK